MRNIIQAARQRRRVAAGRVLRSMAPLAGLIPVMILVAWVLAVTYARTPTPARPPAPLARQPSTFAAPLLGQSNLLVQPAQDVAPPSPVASLAPSPSNSTALPSPFPVRQAQLRDLSPGDCVNLRQTSGLAGSVVRCLPGGTALQLIEGPQEADGHQWWRVDAGGWIASDYFASPPASSPAPASADAIGPLPASIASFLSSSWATAYGPLFGAPMLGWATYYGIEDGFTGRDIMNDGTPYNPQDPTITAASFTIPLHTWLRVCTIPRCILVQVRDRGRLDENGILLDLSRAGYALLFGGLGGKQWVSVTALQSPLGILPTSTIGNATGTRIGQGSP